MTSRSSAPFDLFVLLLATTACGVERATAPEGDAALGAVLSHGAPTALSASPQTNVAIQLVPTNLRSTGVTSTTIDLAWHHASSFESGFEVRASFCRIWDYYGELIIICVPPYVVEVLGQDVGSYSVTGAGSVADLLLPGGGVQGEGGSQVVLLGVDPRRDDRALRMASVCSPVSCAVAAGRLRTGIAGLALGAVACGDEPMGVRRVEPPTIVATTVTPALHNVMAAIVTLRARSAYSAVVRHRFVGAAAASAVTTPAVPVLAESALLPVLGLQAAARHEMELVVYGAGGVVSTALPELTTGALPADLPRYTASGVDPSPGYVAFTAGRYALVIDNDGRVVWYRRFPDGAGLNFMAQPTGRYVIRPPTPATGDIEPWLELDATGEIVRAFGCAGGLPSRLHDVILAADGSHWILCDETRTIDLSASGGVTDARVTGTVVQRVSAAGVALFHWSPFDHFDITDIPLAARAGQNVNWTHGNALDLDTDGNLIVSFRNLSEVTKIDVRTGAVVWRMGGRRNQFTFVDAQTPPFARQHSTRAHAPGSLLLLDNLGNPADSRAEHYVVDEAARRVRLERSYGAAPPVVTQIGGSVQALAGGRTLVTFGTAGRVEEYDATGRVVWRIEGNAGYVFRAQRFASLYAPGVGASR